MTRHTPSPTANAQDVTGPYWVRTNTNGTHDVCGRHGKTVRQYRADMMAAADADCRKLQAGHVRSAKQLSDAAPDLLEALEKAVARFDRCAEMIESSFNITGMLRLERAAQAKAYADEARATLAKATAA